jgi:tRNA(Ile)-lysidine synthase
MLDDLVQVLRLRCQLLPDQPVLVGVSGGPDSLCLLDTLDRLGYKLVIAHFNHQLRAEAGRESKAIEAFCVKRKLPFVSGQGDVRALAKEQHQSIEEAAREARYHFLFDQAAQHEVQAVAVGHTADDQVETVLMHLLRGSGLAGLSGMAARAVPNAWSETIPLIRPLLGFWRRQIEGYCSERGLAPIADPTNLDLAYYRNRLRHELIPYLEGYNPAVRQVIWRTGEILRGDLEIVIQAVEGVWENCIATSGPGYVALNKGALLEQVGGIQRHVIRRAIAQLRPGLRDIDFEAVERVLERIADPEPRDGIDLMAGLRLDSERDLLWLVEWHVEPPGEDWPKSPTAKTELAIPGQVALQGGWVFASHEDRDSHRARREAKENTDPFQAWIDLDRLSGPISVRSRETGDRFQPLGMGGQSVKLSDFMINRKIPRRARQAWPLVCAGDEIVWIPGIQLAHPYRLKDGTTRIAHLRLSRIR